MGEEQIAKIKGLNFEQRKFAYEVLTKEIEYRRDKIWKIFSWVSTILIGTIGGLVAVATKSDNRGPDVLPCWPHRILLLSAIGILTIYSILWITRNQRAQKAVSQEMESYGVVRNIGEEGVKKYPIPTFGSRGTIVLLALAVSLSILLIPSTCPGITYIFGKLCSCKQH
ncbi:MAG TPA: hypothetical protein VF538_05475 [Pyrinomonadaceae bacterium]|jgi:hypothetical protein